MNFEQQIQQLFKESFHQPPIPLSIKQRTLAEKQFIQSIQYQLKRQRLIPEKDHLNDILALIDSQLQVLNNKKLINDDYLNQFSTSHRSNLKLPHLYFLPETNDDVHMCVQPRFSSYQHSPVQRLAQYLEPLIRSLFDNICRSTTVLNSQDFNTKFFHYWMQQSHTKQGIQFATFKIHDLYSNISHKELLEGLHTLLVNPLIIGR
ncbi:unnamed protein product, partial [Rotaria magnacalcarata]